LGLVDGHRALVTGGASGIGRATARRLAAEGASVAVLDLDLDGARAVAEEIGGTAHEVDVADGEAVDRVVAEAAEAMGGLSLAFNNAGAGFLAPLAEFPFDEWDRLVRVNLSGVFHSLRAEVPRMTGGGAIVNTASISGVRPAPGEAPYAAAKAGVAALTASAAFELAPAIRVNAVAPGTIRTGMTDLMLGEPMNLEKVHLDKTPLERIGEPEEVADVVLFLLSDLSRFVTGQNLVVDGGMILHGSGVDGMLDTVQTMLGNA